MKLRFLGVLQAHAQVSGCSSCGNRTIKSSNLYRKNYKEYMLPSGGTIKPRTGQVIDVTTEDGLYLMELSYVIQGQEYFDFEVV